MIRQASNDMRRSVEEGRCHTKAALFRKCACYFSRRGKLNLKGIGNHFICGMAGFFAETVFAKLFIRCKNDTKLTNIGIEGNIYNSNYSRCFRKRKLPVHTWQ